EEGRAQRAVADVAARQRITPRELREVEAARARYVQRDVCGPQLAALIFVGKWEVQAHRQPALERGVDRALEVGGQDRDALEAIEPLQQIVGLEVRVAIVGRLDLAALAEQRVGFVEL